MKYNYFCNLNDPQSKLSLSRNGKHIYHGIRLFFIGILVSFMLSFKVQAADIIVNNTVPPYHYSLNDIKAIFMMRKVKWPNGQFIRVFVLGDNHPVHKDFAKNNLGLFPHQLRSFWDRQVLSGMGQAPVQVNSIEEMLRVISLTPYSIGYVGANPGIPGIRTLVYHF